MLCNSKLEGEKKAIPLEKLCDGRVDCKNMADETSMFCPGWLACIENVITFSKIVSYHVL